MIFLLVGLLVAILFQGWCIYQLMRVADLHRATLLYLLRDPEEKEKL